MTTTIEESNSSNLDNLSTLSDMTFNEVNVTTGKPWTRQELWNKWQLEKEVLASTVEVLASTDEENASLRRQLSKALKQREDITEQLLTTQQYIRDIKLRWKIHSKEASQAVVDVINLGAKTREVTQPTLAKFSNLYGSLASGFNKA